MISLHLPSWAAALQLLGVDPFAEAPFRSYLGAQGQTPVAELTLFLTQPGAVLISSRVAGSMVCRPVRRARQ